MNEMLLAWYIARDYSIDIYIYTYTYIHIHIYIYTYIHIYIYTYIHMIEMLLACYVVLQCCIIRIIQLLLAWYTVLRGYIGILCCKLCVHRWMAAPQ